jgi:glucose-1-phosphate thymidylyltransferase
MDIRLEFKVQKEPRGLAEAFILGEDFIDNGKVAMILGDNIFEDDLSEKIIGFSGGGLIFAKEVSDPERSGVVEFADNGEVISIEEKPAKPKSNFAISGLYVYDKEVVEIAKKLTPSDRGELEITDIHNEYLKKGKLKVEKLEGVWMDAGTIDSLLEAGQVVKDKMIYAKMHPLINKAIKKFSEELRIIAKKRL